MARRRTKKFTDDEVHETCDEAGITPLAFLLGVIKNPNIDLKVKIDAAGKALPFVHRRLSSVEVEASHTFSQEEALDELDG